MIIIASSCEPSRVNQPITSQPSANEMNPPLIKFLLQLKIMQLCHS